MMAVGVSVAMLETIRKRETQLAVGVGQREVFLVGLHGQDQAFLRHGQELFLELAFVDHRPFDQRGHFVQQRFRHQHLVGAGLGQQFGADFLLALLDAGQHLAFGRQRGGVAVGVGDGDRALARRGQEAVAFAGVGGGQAQQRQWQHGGAVQRDQAVRRTHELHGGAVGTLIAHHFRNRQLGDRFFQRGLQARLQCAAGRGVGVEEAFSLAVLRAFQVGHGQLGEAQRGQFLGQRRRAVAGRVQRHRHRQHFFADRLVRRDSAHLGDRDGQAARRGVRGGDAVGFQEVARFQAVTMPSAKALPSLASAFGGSSSVSSSMSRV